LPVSSAQSLEPSYREGISCPHCIDRFSDADRERFAERQRQMHLARERGQQHLG